MRTTARHAALLPLLLAVSALGAESGTTLSSKTPFGTVRSAGPAGEASGETIEFAAVSTIGKTTELVFHDKTTKKNTWLTKGDTKAGITLLNYDAGTKQAVVKVNGVEKTLSLRKSQGPAGANRTVAAVPTGFNVPSPSAATPATMPPPADATTPAIPLPVTPAGPQTQAQQETEARMLVSDLLEIGMAQRKAYEEKQRQAASGGTETAPATNPTGAPKS